MMRPPTEAAPKQKAPHCAGPSFVHRRVTAAACLLRRVKVKAAKKKAPVVHRARQWHETESERPGENRRPLGPAGHLSLTRMTSLIDKCQRVPRSPLSRINLSFAKGWRRLA
jgi:hypothetical protein